MRYLRMTGPTGDSVVPGSRDRIDRVLLSASRIVLAATVRAGNALDPPLTPMQVRTLTLLASSSDGLSVNAVAALLAASASATSRLCARLVRDGLVHRAAGPGNELRLSLTSAGVEALTRLNRRRAEQLRELLGALDAAERRAVVNALESLVTVADENSW